jgi:predicted amidohydrolase
MQNTLRLGLVQMSITNGNLDLNRSRAEAMIRDAAAKGANLIALPEFFHIAGCKAPKEQIAEPVSGPTVNHFALLAKELKVYIVLGSILEKAADGRYFNTAALLDDKGAIAGIYRKNHLWCSELESTTPGDSAPVFSTPWGSIGVMLCWDLAYPALAQRMAAAGARLIVCCAHWQANDRFGPFANTSPVGRQVPNEDGAEDRFVDGCSAARAFENAVAFAFVNAWGPNSGSNGPDRRIGRSQVVLPFHGRVRMAGEREEIVIADLDLAVMDTAATVYGLRGRDWK